MTAFSAIAAVGSMFTYVFGAWNKTFQLMLILIVYDMLTGVIIAAKGKSPNSKNGKLSSEAGEKGFLKKIALISGVGLANLVGMLFPGDMQRALREGAVIAVIWNEAVSVIACMVRYKTNLLVIGGEANNTAMGVDLTYDEEKSAAYKRSNPGTWIAANAITRMLLLYPLAQIAAYLGAETVAELLDALDVPGIFISAETANAYDADYVYVSNEKPADLEPITSTYAFDDFVVTGTALEEELVDEPDFAWYGETGNLGLDEPDEKRIRVLQIRAKSGPEATLHVQAMFDGANAGEMLRCENRGKTGTYRVAFTPARRCDTYKLRLSGTGDTVLYSITTETEDAGDNVR